MTSWSHSQYALALQCLRKYKYVYVDKLEPEGLESADLAFGTALHTAIHAALTGQDSDTIFRISWAGYLDNVEFGRFSHAQLLELGLGFLAKFTRTYASKFEPKLMESRLYGEYRGIKLEGTPDFFGLYEGEMTLADWKTTGTNYHKDKALSGLQLYLYAYLGIQNGFDAPRQLLYLPFNKGLGSIQRPVVVPFSESDMIKALDNMVDYIESMDTTKYPANYGSCFGYNKQCEYFSRCFPKEDK